MTEDRKTQPTDTPTPAPITVREPAAAKGVVVAATTTGDDPGRDGVRLAVILLASTLGLIALFATGAIARHAGFDAWLGAGPLEHSIDALFVTGVLLPVEMVRSLYLSGVSDPLFFAASLALVIPPVAGLAAARPTPRGAARPSGAVAAASGLTAALVIVADILIGVRTAGGASPTLANTDLATDWFASLQVAAAGDAVAMIIAILLAVLVFRLPADRWVRGLAGTIAVAIAIVASVGAAASAGRVAMVESTVPVLTNPGDDSRVALLGTRADGQAVGMRTQDGAVLLFVPDRGISPVVERRSVRSILDETPR